MHIFGNDKKIYMYSQISDVTMIFIVPTVRMIIPAAKDQR